MGNNRGGKNGRKPLIDNVCGNNGTQNSKENKDISQHILPGGGGHHTQKMLTCSWLNNM